MTRHGKVEPSTAGAQPPATDPCASIVNIAADRGATSLVWARLDRPEAQRSGLSASILALPSSGRAFADIDRRSKSP